MSSPARVHDPLFHFETHFPDKLSRLHLNPELAHFQSHQGSIRRSRRSRATRNSSRYKTQPVTFDEIQEVDEETVSEQKTPENLKGQFQAFSRSMDGLVPNISEGSKESTESNDIAKGKDALKSTTTGTGTVDISANGRADFHEQCESTDTNKENEPHTTSAPINVPSGSNNQGRPTRRPRLTAKAKRRQMMAEAQEYCGTEGGGDVET